jgi:hypothetical protein
MCQQQSWDKYKYFRSSSDQQERSQRGCPRCSDISLEEKMPGEGYRAEELFTTLKIFSSGKHPP